jgi:hypothetical protein
MEINQFKRPTNLLKELEKIHKNMILALNQIERIFYAYDEEIGKIDIHTGEIIYFKNGVSESCQKKAESSKEPGEATSTTTNGNSTTKEESSSNSSPTDST